MQSCIINYLDRPFIKRIIYFLCIISALVPIVGSLLSSSIHCDTSFYLSIVNRITDGYIPYKTIGLGYCPFWFYLMALLKTIFNLPPFCFKFYLLIHYLFVIGISYFLYKILLEFKVAKILSFIAGWLFIIASHWMHGNIILLEIPSVFWGVLSMYLIVKFTKKSYWHYIYIGLFACLSFLTKQFGLGFLFLDIALIIITQKDRMIKTLLLFMLGYVFPIIICYLYWGMDFTSVIFSKYGSESAVEAGRTFSVINAIGSVVSNLWILIKRAFPALLICLLYIPEMYKSKYRCIFLVYFMGIIGFSCQYIFVGGGWHYSLYMVPFVIMLIFHTFNLDTSYKWKRVLLSFALVIVIALSLYSTFYNRVYKQYILSTDYQCQKEVSSQVLSFLDSTQTIWTPHGGLFYIYYMTNLLPPNISTIGYSFGPLGINKEEAALQIDSADYVLRFSADYSYENYFTDSLKSVVEKFPTIAFQDSTILLHKMK